MQEFEGIELVESAITRDDLKRVAERRFGDMVKAVVDVELGIMAIGGELHADEEALLLSRQSKQSDLWGINLYPGVSGDDWLEFDSMINIRPSQNNRSRGVDDVGVQGKIRTIVSRLVK